MTPQVEVGRRSPPSGVVVAVLAGAGLAAAAASLLMALSNEELDHPGIQGALLGWIILSYVMSGLVAWSRRPESRFGPLMIAAGIATFLTTLYWSHQPVLTTVALALDYVPPALFLHVFLAFPTGRVPGRLDRTLVCGAYGASVVFSLVRMLLGAFADENVLSVVDEPVFPLVLERLQLVVMAALALGGIVSLVLRRRGARRRLRQVPHSRGVLIDAFAVALGMIAVLFLNAAFLSGVSWSGFETFRRATFFVVSCAPVAFLIGLLQDRLSRTGVSDLLIDLRDDLAPAGLRDALSRALRDPTLSVAYWLPQFGSWADTDGNPVRLPVNGEQVTTLIERNGLTVAALLHDPSLRDEPELVNAVGAAAGIALENGRLHAELQARVEELAGSRARVIEAGQRERQRLERNLHDGAQQRLVALSLELGLLQERLDDDPATRVDLDRARRTIAMSLEELRDLARGIHPAVVSGHGLAVALEELAVHSAVPVRLDVSLTDRLAEPVEIAAYYVVCECLANLGKHAQASSAAITVSCGAGVLVVEVVDDGVGGADPDRGGGLRGLADRVEALGGRLAVWSPAGAGTRVRAELSCG